MRGPHLRLSPSWPLTLLVVMLVACGAKPVDETSLIPPPRASSTPPASGGTSPSPSFDPRGAAETSSPCVLGETRACGAPGPQNGICRSGVQTCERVGAGEVTRTTFGACVGAQAPRAETCNGLDDDCNGLVDDGVSCALPVADAGVDVSEPPPPPPPVAKVCDERCAGASIVLDRTATFGVWVKVVLCSSARYDLFMGPSATGPFSKIGDLTNGGQDHCELVNPTFTLGNEATISSGSCPSCALGPSGRARLHPAEFGTTLYYRALLGDAFQYTADIPTDAFNADTPCWYECGVSF